MLEENNPRDFMDVFLLQMEAENSVENSTFTGMYFQILNISCTMHLRELINFTQ
jgi:hypothetical protein